MRSCLASRRSVSGWGHVTHGARAPQPNGFRFRFIPRKVPGISAHWFRRREGGGEPEARAMAHGPGGLLPLCRRRSRETATIPLRPTRLSQFLLWFLDNPAYSASGRSSPPLGDWAYSRLNLVLRGYVH